MLRTTALLGALLVPATCFGGTLTTTTPNNGSGGIFMDLTAAAQELWVTSFDTYFTGTAGTAVDVAVYIRPGSYVGFESSEVGWTLSETVSALSAGQSTLAAVALNNDIAIGAGQTVAVYLHATTSGGGIRYNGTGSSIAQNSWSNSDLTIFSNHARTGAAPFSGTRFTPRTFAGNINYTFDGVVENPEPANISLLGLGIAGLAFLRRKSA